MAKKTSIQASVNQESIGDNIAPEISPVVESAIIAEANAQIVNAKGRIKETKKLGKAIAIINQCSEWGCDQLLKAITARLTAIE